MANATLTDLCADFEKVRRALQRDGEVIITERGKPAFVLRPYSRPASTRPVKVRGMAKVAQMLNYMPKP